ncbi:MAG: DUF4180 domain-containing protein [Propionibacteriaceae bacterium]|jgi:hypothetical protein|nr:DUF4180 domain-containing protein [Propionibacteriaceae bacterium]
MKFDARTANGIAYVAVVDGQVTEESDANDAISACWSYDTRLLFLPQSAISEEFRRLSTRVAGQFLGKLANYQVRTAAVIDGSDATGPWGDFLSEAKMGTDFRVCASEEEAVAWLTEDPGISDGR